MRGRGPRPPKTLGAGSGCRGRTGRWLSLARRKLEGVHWKSWLSLARLQLEGAEHWQLGFACKALLDLQGC